MTGVTEDLKNGFLAPFTSTNYPLILQFKRDINVWESASRHTPENTFICPLTGLVSQPNVVKVNKFMYLFWADSFVFCNGNRLCASCGCLIAKRQPKL